MSTPTIRNTYFDLLCSRAYKEDKDAIVVHAGERGACKSGNAITTGQILDREKDGTPRFFLPDSMVPEGMKLRPGEHLPRVVFKPSDFLRLVSKEKLPKGSVIVWDETGIEGDARDFQTKKNKLLKRTMESIRSRNLIIILTAPTLKSFDIGFQRSMSFYVECQGKVRLDTGKRVSKAVIYETITNPKTGTIYTYRLRDYSEFGASTKERYFYFPRPVRELERPYKRYKKLFQTKLYADYAKELDSMDELIDPQDEENSKKSLSELADIVLVEPKKFYEYQRKKFSLPALIDHLDITPRKASDLKQLLEYRLKRGVFSV